MKKTVFVIGIVIIAACVLALLYAGLNLFGYYRVLDGSAELYQRLHHRAVLSALIGAVLGIIGIACIVIRSRI